MRRLVREGMEQGAAGLSAGLEYTPGRWSRTDEVVALVEEIVPYGGIYISHQRSEGADPMWFWPSQDLPGAPNLIDAVLETIEVGERTGATVVASHLKAKGAHYWGTSHTVIQLIEQARARGVSVWGDQYPYNTSGTDGSTVLIPQWVWWGAEEGDYAKTLRRVLDQPETAAAVRRDVAHEIRRRGGASSILVLDYSNLDYVGKNLAELAAEREVDPVEMAFLLQFEGQSNRPGGVGLRGFSMSEADVEAYAAQPWIATTSDAGIALVNGPPVHPRFYGTFPRKLYRYALERGVVTLPHAIRSATSLPAQILGLRDRGQVREGFQADLVVIDLGRLRDRATTFQPHQYSDGVEYVLVGGTFVVEDGKPTWILPGRVLTPSRPVSRSTGD
jgi:N-acyl-D-amino-acid deacylase